MSTSIGQHKIIAIAKEINNPLEIQNPWDICAVILRIQEPLVLLRVRWDTAGDKDAGTRFPLRVYSLSHAAGILLQKFDVHIFSRGRNLAKYKS